MRRREFLALVGSAAVSPIAAPAQLAKVARIGIVSIGGSTADMMGPLPPNRTVRAFLRGMAELGYVYGRDFVTEPRGTDGTGAVAELVASASMSLSPLAAERRFRCSSRRRRRFPSL